MLGSSAMYRPPSVYLVPLMENAASGRMWRRAESPVRRFSRSTVPKLGAIVNVRSTSPLPSLIMESPESVDSGNPGAPPTRSMTTSARAWVSSRASSQSSTSTAAVTNGSAGTRLP